jgi:hypothetical protein
MATMLMLALPSGSIVNVQPMYPWRKEAPKSIGQGERIDK